MYSAYDGDLALVDVKAVVDVNLVSPALIEPNRDDIHDQGISAPRLFERGDMLVGFGSGLVLLVGALAGIKRNGRCQAKKGQTALFCLKRYVFTFHEFLGYT
jgi:hypothetical protein